MSETKRLLVCGASARQIVSLAQVACYDCIALDLFQDQDTKSSTQLSAKLRGFDEIQQAVSEFDFDVLVLAGGMENLPETVETVCDHLPCKDINAFRSMRNPFLLSRLVAEDKALKHAGVCFPDTTRTLQDVDAGQVWLIKQTDGAGGLSVDFASRQTSLQTNEYLQRFVKGHVVSGLFIADGKTARLLGTSQSKFGMPEFGSTGFIYCGSVSPSGIRAEICEKFELTGKIFAAEFGLKGVFGVDFVVEESNTERPIVWVLEINPRITASAEVVQPSTTENLVDLHVRALTDPEFRLGAESLLNFERSPDELFFGKAILYRRSGQPIAPELWSELRLRQREPSIAGIDYELCDIPSPFGNRIDGTQVIQSDFKQGAPLLTIKASAQTKTAVESKLIRAAVEVYGALESGQLKGSPGYSNRPNEQSD